MSQSTLKTALKAIFDEQKTKTNQQDSIDEISDDMATAITDEISDIGFLNDRGNWDASGNVFPSTGGSGALGAIEKGDIWTISVEGTLGGTTVYVGNTIRALQDLPLQVSGNWAIGETTSDHAGLGNLDYENSGHTGFQPSDTTALTADTPLDEDLFDFWDVVDSVRKKITFNALIDSFQIITQVTGLTLSSGSWSLVSGLYEYDLSNANITASSFVDIVHDNADYEIVQDAQILPKTLSSSGSVKIYSVNEPTDDIGVTITVYKAITNVTEVTGLTLSSGSWSLVSGLYEYDLSNSNITTDSFVDVIPDNADYSTMQTAEMLPKTLSSDGSVKLYSINEPTDDIGITIRIYE